MSYLTITDRTAGTTFYGRSLESAARTRYGRRAFPRVSAPTTFNQSFQEVTILQPIDIGGYRVLASWYVTGLRN